MKNIFKKIHRHRLAKKFEYLRYKTSKDIPPAVDVLIKRRFTKFDLPTLKTSRSSRFHHLRTHVWRRSSIGRPTYQHIRNIALERLQHDMIKSLSIIYDLHICKHGLSSDQFLPHRLYSWDLGDFFNRRKLDTVWIDVLKVQLDNDCFSTRKFKTDLEELRRYLRLIFEYHTEKHYDPKLRDKLFGYFEETLSLIEYENSFYTDIRVNKRSLTDTALQYINFTENPHRERKNFMYKLFLEEKYMNADVFNPIEMRYQLRYYDNRVKEFESKCGTIEEKVLAEIKHYKRLTELENLGSVWLITFYNNEIESFKDRSHMLAATYDVEFEKIDNQNTYYKIKIDKLKEQRKFLTEQLSRFREELEQWREKEQAQHESMLAAQEKKRLQSEANKLAKAMKKAKLAEKKAAKGKAIKSKLKK